MPYGLAEHRHRFAVWAAARAAQRGFTTVRNLRDALQATDIRAVLASPSTFEYSATQFDELHRRWCLSICTSLADRGLSKEKRTYGRAAKLVAVYLKAIVMMGDQCDSRFARNMHPPIDRILLQGLEMRAGPRPPPKPSTRRRSLMSLILARSPRAGVCEIASLPLCGAPWAARRGVFRGLSWTDSRC